MRSSKGSLSNIRSSKSEEGQELRMEDYGDYTEEPWRFVNTAVFVLACLVNSLPTHTFTPINSIVDERWNIGRVAISFNTLVFPISHPILAFVANWVLDKYGLRIGCSIGMVFLAIGVWLRCLINYSFAPVLIGSLMAAIGNIFIINSPAKLAGTWYRPILVPRITVIGVMSNMASIGLGVVFPTLFVNQHSTKKDITRMLVIQAIIVSIPSILLVALFRSKPVKPPSFAAGLQSKSGYLEDLKKMFTNKNYLFLLLAVSMSYGSLTALTACIQYIAKPFGFAQPEKVSSAMLLCSMGSGLFSSVFFVILLKKSLAYKKILLSAMIGSVLELVVLIFVMDLGKLWPILVIFALIGFFFIPQIAIFLDFGCQLVFPIGQASSSGFLLAGGQLTGFLAGLAGISVLDGNSKNMVYVVISCVCGMMCVGMVGMWFVKEDLRKVNYEKSASELSVKNI